MVLLVIPLYGPDLNVVTTELNFAFSFLVGLSICCRKNVNFKQTAWRRTIVAVLSHTPAKLFSLTVVATHILRGHKVASTHIAQNP